MLQVDWGNIALAFAALGGFMGWMANFGLETTLEKPPADDLSMEEMEEPELILDFPGDR